ncbi:MAG TPA: hypothetical protein VH478_09575 [Trebonia sp.]|nr:hypothetical protein [Trebonia sp.]
MRGSWWWPFLVVLLITGYGYLLGLSNFGVAEEGAADDAGPGVSAPRGARSSR